MCLNLFFCLGGLITVKYAENLDDFALAFDPDALTGEYLDKFYYPGTMPIRMNDANESPMDDIFKSCLMPRNQNAHLLLGHTGCGKSTELNMLKKRFEGTGRKVSVIRCLVEADLMGLAYWDLLILLGKHLCEIARDSECILPESLLDKINHFWKEEEVIEDIEDAGELNLKAGVSASTPKILTLLRFFTSVSSELKYGYSKRNTIRERVKKSAAQWIGYMKEVSDHITSHFYGKQPIVIFEDLDKLTPEKAWEIFFNNPLTQMPFPVIYTFPISLSYDPKFASLEASFGNNIQILPMIKIRNIDGSPCQYGINTLRNIVEKRVSLALFDEEALTFLIAKTGGILRDLFNRITKAASRAENRKATKIELEDARATTIQLRSLLTRRIESKNYPLLKNIQSGKKYKNQIEDKAMLLEMMQGLIVLEYNGDRWHDLHPLIEDFLKEQGELS